VNARAVRRLDEKREGTGRLACMEGGAAERDRLLRQQIAVMPADRFEQLVFELAHREDSAVRRLAPPDGGADAIRPASGTRRAAAWQAKHYPAGINWVECEASLDAAIKRWDPEAVTFVFPRDLSQQLEATFEERLVRRAVARDAGVTVTMWNRSEIVRRLDEHPDLKLRFFGADQDDLAARLGRLVEAGGSLDDGRDIMSRAIAIGEFAESQDTDFTHAVSVSGERREPNWSSLPFMTLEVEGERVAVRIDAWSRESANVEPPSFAFSADEAGQIARKETVERLARGEPAVVTAGGQLRLQVPIAMQPFLNEAVRAGGSITLTPGDPLEIEIEIESPDAQSQARTLEVRPIPPRPGARLAFAGYAGNVLIELNIELLEEPQISLSVAFSARWGSSARENIDAAQLLHALFGHERITLRNPMLFPGRNGRMGKFHQGPNEKMLAQVEQFKAFYEDIALIEGTLGIELVIPGAIQHDDVRAAATAANVLRTGEGSATFKQVETTVSLAEIPHVAERLRDQGPVHRNVTYPLFGSELDLGEAEYELPPLRIIEVAPQGVTPNASARVVLAADGDGQTRFRLVSPSVDRA
jgi:hypothetical protein